MYFKIWTFSTITSLLIGILVLPQANASQKITYSLTVPFESTYKEEGALKPGAKLSPADIKFALSDNCDYFVGTKPRLEVRTAGFKTVPFVNMNPAHKLSSTKWTKDENGENIFLFRGICSYLGVITKKLPDSNFYQFSAKALTGGKPSSWSYPYTLQQLASMRGGIKETRPLVTEENYYQEAFGTFTPVPQIETPKVQPLKCTEGYMIKTDSSNEEFVSEGGVVEVAYFMITNGVYRPQVKEFNSPSIQHVGDRIQNTRDYSISVDGIYSIKLLSENTPAFVTWRRPGEESFSTSLDIFYRSWGAEEKHEIPMEKTFNVRISSDCKRVSIATP